jgi:hypothetical protein
MIIYIHLNNKIGRKIMMPSDVIEHFGTWTNASRALLMGNSTFNQWRVKGYVPIRTQHIIERKTEGALKADPRHDLELFTEKK